MKRCGGCRKVFPATPDHFYRHAGRSDGLSCWCKDCQRESTRRYRAKRRENGGKPLGKLKVGDMKRCPDCGETKPWTRDFFHPDRREGRRVVKLGARCKDCTREHVRYIRERDVSGFREKANERRRRRMQDPEYAQRMRAYQREYRERVKADPHRHAKSLEQRRIAARLRRERAGEPLAAVAAVTPLPIAFRSVGTLPAAPLVSEIDKWRAGRPERIVQQLGVNERQLREWRSGGIDSVQFDVADRVLVRLNQLLPHGLLWWEVWREGEEGYERACELFTGEVVAA